MLEVVCFDRRAGTLSDSPGGLSFTYDPTWVAGGGHPLSQSLPLNGDFGPAQVESFFGGLLPEGPPRELLARQLGVSAGNDYGLLERLGGDTAGAVSLGLPDTVANEALCLEIGRRLGVPTAQAHLRRAGDRECLLVARYDRGGRRAHPAAAPGGLRWDRRRGGIARGHAHRAGGLSGRRLTPAAARTRPGCPGCARARTPERASAGRVARAAIRARGRRCPNRG